jgi:SAM-dependent methyltransferase
MSEGLIYFKDGELVAESGDTRVYKMNGELFLEKGPGHNLWALESELQDYIEQLDSWPNGNCLEIGLGLGVASHYLLTFPKVKTLTTVEIDKDVIAVQKKANPINDKRHIILNANGLYFAYQTKRVYDFIFLDFYSHIDEDTLPEIADMVVACRRILKSDGHMIGWLDPYTPGDSAKIFLELFH